MMDRPGTYFPDDKLHWLDELRKLEREQDRSVNHVVLMAVGEYLAHGANLNRPVNASPAGVSPTSHAVKE